MVGLILGHVLEKKERFWVTLVGVGCRGFDHWHGLWSGSVVVRRWLLAEVGGFGLLGLTEVGRFGLLQKLTEER